MAEKTFQPKILAFLCNWCAYGAADLAGVSRLRYPPHVRPIRVMCSASVSPHHILRAFQSGADGILVGACHVGDCHYQVGNHMALKRIRFLQEMLAFVGLEGRLRLEWISSAEGPKFAQVVREFTEEIRALGPSPVTERKKPKEMVHREFIMGRLRPRTLSLEGRRRVAMARKGVGGYDA